MVKIKNVTRFLSTNHSIQQQNAMKNPVGHFHFKKRAHLRATRLAVEKKHSPPANQVPKPTDWSTSMSLIISIWKIENEWEFFLKTKLNKHFSFQILIGAEIVSFFIGKLKRKKRFSEKCPLPIAKKATNEMNLKTDCSE